MVGGFGLVAAAGAEGLEVMVSMEDGEGGVQPFRIEPARQMPGEAVAEGGEDGRRTKIVVVGFSAGGKAGVEIRRDLGGLHHADRPGEFGIEGGEPVPGAHGECGRRIEMGRLGERVDASIGAAGAVDADGLAGDGGGGLFKQVLDGVSPGLRLPAVEGASVIGKGESQSHPDATLADRCR